jgi:hypothetical protein
LPGSNNHLLMSRYHPFRYCCAGRFRLRTLFFAASGFVSLPRTAIAQLAESIASVGTESYPYSHMLDGSQRQAKIDLLRATLTLPFPLSRQTLLLLGVAYEQFDAQLRGDEFQRLPTLRSLVGSFGYVQNFGSFTGIAIVGAGKASEFSDESSRGGNVFTLSGIGLYKLSDSFSVGAAISYDQRKGTPTPLPAVKIHWRFTEYMQLRGFIPSRLDLELRANRWVTGGIRAALNDNRYQLATATHGVSQIDYVTVAVGPKLTLSAGDWVHLDLSASAAVYRHYDLYHGQTNAGGESVAPAVAFGVRLWIGPSPWTRR